MFWLCHGSALPLHFIPLDIFTPNPLPPSNHAELYGVAFGLWRCKSCLGVSSWVFSISVLCVGLWCVSACVFVLSTVRQVWRGGASCLLVTLRSGASAGACLALCWCASQLLSVTSEYTFAGGLEGLVFQHLVNSEN